LDANGITVEEEEIGHIVVTDLMNHVMPFVRYDTGDEGSITYSQCPCGRLSPRLLKLRGRACDYIQLPSKTKVPALRFNVLFEQMGNIIHEFQIKQESVTKILLRVVPGRLFSSNWNEERTKELITSLLSHEMEVIIEVVDSIPRTKSGKFKYIIPIE
jgi:phenylacetate-CoA ligase